MRREEVIKKLVKSIEKQVNIINVGECDIVDGRLTYNRNKIEQGMRGVYFFLGYNGELIDQVRYSDNITRMLSQVNDINNPNGPSRQYENLLPAKKRGSKLYLYILKPHGRTILSDFASIVSDTLNTIQSDISKKVTKEYNEIANILTFKKQIILQGAPGTGKTYTAKKVAEEMGIDYDIIQFHPSYTYEDFVRGISAKSENGNITYKIEDKILMNVVNNVKDKPYILIIDEINRANLPSVLGELLYALEYRGEAVKCPYGESITIPENLYIIGTMNTADRSIGSIDYAIRRRFAFYTVSSNSDIIEDEQAKNLYKKVYELIDKYISEEYNIDDIMVGHSYFLSKEDDCPENYIELSLKYNIKPLLVEYYKDGILIDQDGNNVESVEDAIENLEI